MGIKKPIVVTEYPKSGGSWITSMLGDILEVPKRDIYVRENFDLFDLSDHPWYKDAADLSFPDKSVIKSHELPDSPLIDFDATFIHLVRDGRDVVISKWFFEKEFCVKNGILTSFEKNFNDYVLETAKEWSSYIKSWSGRAHIMIRYEDFLTSPEITLKTLVSQVTEDFFPDDQFQKTVAKFSKSNFSSSLNKTFKHNTFVRKGISGDWKNYFSQTTTNLFKSSADDALVLLGYESNSGWNFMMEKMNNRTSKMRKCWCGNEDFNAFSLKYNECKVCGTLISQDSLSDEQLTVKDDETDFYGKKYWTDHQNKDLGFPSIHTRTRSDLTERNLHWLETLMKYCLPPAKILELGCSHGSFVAVMQNAGYQSSGVEMSPWVVDFGSKTFNVQIHLGPIENLNFVESTFDVIALMDVLEHLPDPSKTLNLCARLLKPDGFFLIQTPEFDQEITYSELVEKQSPFLEQLKADEHLYLFSQSSVTKLLKQTGFEYINFEPAIFSDYDMFFVASKQELKTYSRIEWEEALLSSPSSRFVLAMLDLRERELALEEQLIACDADRIDKLEQITKLSDWLKQTQALLETAYAQMSNPLIKVLMKISKIASQLTKKT